MLALIGQALFFVTSGVRAVQVARTKWFLTQRGILGPNGFLPWQRVSAYDWQDSNTLLIITRKELGRERRFKVSVVSEACERAAAILARNLGSH